eukprot:139376_1
MGNDPISTAIDAIADNRTYYNCPRCHRRVYAYGAFVGNVCLDCPGTVLSAVGNTTSMATCGITKPVATVISQIAPAVTKTITIIPDAVVSTSIPGCKAKHSAATLVWSISKGSVSRYNGFDENEDIRRIATRSMGIFTGPLTNTGVDHWWMLIQTD